MLDLLLSEMNFLIPNYRNRCKSQSLKALGMALESGVALEKALFSAAGEATWKPYKYAFLTAARFALDGVTPEEIFTSKKFNIFPGRVRAALASSFLNLKEKGAYVSALSETEAVYVYHGRGDASGFIFGNMLAIALCIPFLAFRFIFPQFREIFMGLKCELPILLRFVYGICGNSLLLINALLCVVFIVVILALGRIGRNLFKSEILELMCFLKKIDVSRRSEILNLLASPALFPKIHGLIRELSSSANMKPPSGNVQLKYVDPLILWTFNIALNSNRSELFESGAQLVAMQAQWEFARKTTLLRCFFVIFIGGYFSIYIFTFFSSISTMLTHLMRG